MKVLIYVNENNISIINELEKYDGTDGTFILGKEPLYFSHERTFSQTVPCMIAYNTYIIIKEHKDESRRK